MSNVRETYKVERTYSVQLKNEITKILKREKTIKSVCDEFGGKGDFPKDTKTLRIRMEELAGIDRDFYELYQTYQTNLNSRPRGYNYAAEILDMLENDLSQREVSESYGINRNTLKDAIKKMKEQDLDLKPLIEEHATRHAQGRNCELISEEDREKNKPIIEKCKIKYNIDRKNTNIEQEELGSILSHVSYLEAKGYTQKQIATELGIAVSTIRRYKAKYERINKIEKNGIGKDE